jgi:hypothetical protein
MAVSKTKTPRRGCDCVNLTSGDKRSARLHDVPRIGACDRAKVDDSGLRRVKTRNACRMWLHSTETPGIETTQAGHAVELAPSLELVKEEELRRARGHDQLPAALVRDASLFAVAIELLCPPDA